MPKSKDPNLLVGIETSDDAGVFKLSETQALVQTVDFFTPIVDDPYDYGQIAAANSLSDVYAMGGKPITVLNICCFDPTMAPPEVWAKIFEGMHDKTIEAGAVIAGGHTVENDQPLFGLSVTGLINPETIFRNDNAKPGQDIYLSKPLGTGIVTTAFKNDLCSDEELKAAVAVMSALNARAAEFAHAAGVRCATDVTGFGLAGHLFHIARASGVTLEIDSSALPLLPGVERLVAAGAITGAAIKTREYIGDALEFGSGVAPWMEQLILDPQTSGGLATFSTVPVEGSVKIGRSVSGPPRIVVS
ncbi:MAG: selenide, water dikinase SelD [Armatimonadetes bacterium]|nr:selenide, water dikinase SelD [Armatimonadota bacterium]